MTTSYPPNFLKNLILESQEEDLPELYPRSLKVPLESRKPIHYSRDEKSWKILTNSINTKETPKKLG